jgi:cytochrome c oxidase subunit II
VTDITTEPTWRGGPRWATLGGAMRRPVRHRPGRRFLLLAFTLPLVLAGCIEDESRPLNIFNPEGPEARRIDALHPWVFGIAAVILVLVVGAVLYLCFANKVRLDEYDPEDLPDQIHGNFRLEISWTILPAVLLAGLAVPTVATWWALERRDADAMEVMVIGQQWWWEYRYDVDGDGFFAEPVGAGEAQHNVAEFDPDDLVVANELVIPAGERIELTITSRDIIHSFWIPRLNGKRDAVPGRFHPWTIHADEPGKYTGWCTEFCGLSHARMRMSVIALPPDEYEQWFQNQLAGADEIAEPADVEADTLEASTFRGQELFRTQCASCHVIDSPAFEYPDDFRAPQVAGVAPDLTKFATRTVYGGAVYSTYLGIEANDNTYDVATYLDVGNQFQMNRAGLRAWIANAPAIKDMAPEEDRGMPAFEGLTDQNLDDLVAYLATLD